MTREEHLLLCLAEECAEVAQRVSKALRFGLSEIQPAQPLTNAERVVDEFHDLFAVATLLEAERIIGHIVPTEATVNAKAAKIERYFAISREQGTLP